MILYHPGHWDEQRREMPSDKKFTAECRLIDSRTSLWTYKETLIYAMELGRGDTWKQEEMLFVELHSRLM